MDDLEITEIITSPRGAHCSRREERLLTMMHSCRRALLACCLAVAVVVCALLPSADGFALRTPTRERFARRAAAGHRAAKREQPPAGGGGGGEELRAGRPLVRSNIVLTPEQEAQRAATQASAKRNGFAVLALVALVAVRAQTAPLEVKTAYLCEVGALVMRGVASHADVFVSSTSKSDGRVRFGASLARPRRPRCSPPARAACPQRSGSTRPSSRTSREETSGLFSAGQCGSATRDGRRRRRRSRGCAAASAIPPDFPSCCCLRRLRRC